MSIAEDLGVATVSPLMIVLRDTVAAPAPLRQALATDRVRQVSARLLEILGDTTHVSPRTDGPVACPGASYAWKKKAPVLD